MCRFVIGLLITIVIITQASGVSAFEPSGVLFTTHQHTMEGTSSKEGVFQRDPETLFYSPRPDRYCLDVDLEEGGQKAFIRSLNLARPSTLNEDLPRDGQGTKFLETKKGSADISPPEEQEYLILASYEDNRIARRLVQYHLDLITTKQRRIFREWLKRSGKYIPKIRQILKEEGLPEELVYLPLIESGFNTRAESRKRAVGPWQFIPATARRYGLKIDFWVDERRDPEKSTRAAARYLKQLYEKFGSWLLALAAYNAGEGKIWRAIRTVEDTDYWRLTKTRYIKRETKNYVARFIAAALVASNPEEYGFKDLDLHPPLRYDKVMVNAPVSLDFVAKCTGVTVATIRELNPELKRWCTPVDVKSYELKVPEGTANEFLRCFNSATPKERLTKIPYLVKKGDTLYEIAKARKVSLRAIMELNRGVNPKRLRPGQVIYLPPL